MFSKDARFLVADDSNMVRDLVRTALAQLGFNRIETAQDGSVALDQIRKSFRENDPFQLVFTDINMPRMDGLRMLEIIRGEANLKDLPVIIVTTESSKQSVVRAVMQGVSGYMVKPFGIEDVKKKVKEIYDRVSVQTTPPSR